MSTPDGGGAFAEQGPLHTARYAGRVQPPYSRGVGEPGNGGRSLIGDLVLLSHAAVREIIDLGASPQIASRKGEAVGHPRGVRKGPVTP